MSGFNQVLLLGRLISETEQLKSTVSVHLSIRLRPGQYKEGRCWYERLRANEINSGGDQQDSEEDTD